MLENGITLLTHFLRTERNSHLNLMHRPFLPRTAIQPDFALLIPVVVPAQLTGAEDGLQTDTVSSMRVCQVTGCIDLMRFQFPQQIHNDLNVGITQRLLLDTTGLVERHVQEVQAVARNSAATGSRDCFALANQPLDHLHLQTVHLPGLLPPQKLFHVIFKFTDLRRNQSEGRTVIGDKF